VLPKNPPLFKNNPMDRKSQQELHFLETFGLENPQLATLRNLFTIFPKTCFDYLLSISEELLESIGKPLGVLDEFTLLLIQSLFTRCTRNVS